MEFQGYGRPPERRNLLELHLYETGSTPIWMDSDKARLNVPVWAMVEDGYLFVRVFRPRVNSTCVVVVQDGSLEMCPNAINVADFLDSID